MPLTENSGQIFLPGGCNRTQNLRFGPYTNILDHSFMVPSEIMAIITPVQRGSVKQFRQRQEIKHVTNFANILLRVHITRH